MALGTYAAADHGRAEVAFVVREEFQNQGIAGHLLGRLRAIAEQNGFAGFEAVVLSTNESMLRVFQKHYPHAEISVLASNDYHILMDFEPTETGAPEAEGGARSRPRLRAGPFPRRRRVG